MSAHQTASAGVRAGELTALRETRARTLALVDGVDDADLARVIDPLLSPLLWDLGHIANFEQRWLLADADDDRSAIYNPFKQPRDVRGELPLLGPTECFAYMEAVRERVAERFDRLDPALVELVIQHEQQHNETMLQLLRQLNGYRPPAWLRREIAGDAEAPTDDGPQWIEYPAGEYAIGRPDPGAGEFAYDNELCAHRVALAQFAIAARPVTNGEYAAWIADGGYVQEESWSPEGRAWLAENPAAHPLGWRAEDGRWFERGFGEARPIDPAAPVCHVSWYEADAFARAHGARLPTEFEWEAAAAHDASAGADAAPTRWAWGEDAWTPELANLDQTAFGTTPCAAPDERPAEMNGQVWEWTASEFAAYPGFEPLAYAEYSAPFFDSGFRVLRGGSWATRARTVDNRFRNWDFPQRRQIFAGFRLAQEAA